jgi:hypothetical protein
VAFFIMGRSVVAFRAPSYAPRDLVYHGDCPPFLNRALQTPCQDAFRAFSDTRWDGVVPWEKDHSEHFCI